MRCTYKVYNKVCFLYRYTSSIGIAIDELIYAKEKHLLQLQSLKKRERVDHLKQPWRWTSLSDRKSFPVFSLSENFRCAIGKL